MRMSPTQIEDIRLTASLPMVLGGMGAERDKSDKLLTGLVGLIVYPMVHQKHPGVAATLVAQLSGNPETRSLSAV